MTPAIPESENVNVLISDANWAWPQAVEKIFQPRGVNALVAENGADVVQLVHHNKIHLAILDMGLDEFSGMQTLRRIRQYDHRLPCILLAQHVDNRLLAEALGLHANSVMAKPVDLKLLENQIDRLFVKNYASNIFSAAIEVEVKSQADLKNKLTKRFSTVIKWSFKKNERSDS